MKTNDTKSTPDKATPRPWLPAEAGNRSDGKEFAVNLQVNKRSGLTLIEAFGYVREQVTEGKLLSNYADASVRNRGVDQICRAARIARRLGYTFKQLSIDL